MATNRQGAIPAARRRILVVAPHYAPGYKAGGALRSLVNIVRGAPPEVDILVVTSDRDLGDDQPYPGIQDHRRREGQAVILYVDPARPSHWWRALREARHFQPDLIYLNSLWNRPFAIAPALLHWAGFLRTSDLMVAPRGQLAPSALAAGDRRAKRLVMNLWRRLLRREGSLVHCTDHREAEQARRALGSAVRVLVSMDPVELPPRARHAGARREGAPLRVISVGRVSRVKNLHTLLEGLTKVTVPVHLRLVGPWEDRQYLDELRTIASRAPTATEIDFVGPLPHEDVIDELGEADLFCMPTLGENFGHVIPEAWSASCPVACGPVTPFSPLVPAAGGELVAHTSPEAWADLIERWGRLTVDELAHRRAQAAQAYEQWRRTRDASHVFEQAAARKEHVEDAGIDFLTYSSRSGSTFLARQIDQACDVLVVPETQCTYHALTLGGDGMIAPELAAEMVAEDRQIYWFDEDGLTSLRRGEAMTPQAFLRRIGVAYATHRSLDHRRRMLFKLGGALHIWPHVTRSVPGARAIDIARDGRAVVNSSLRARAPYFEDSTLAFGDVVRAAKTWRGDRAVSRRLVDAGAAVHTVRYEELIRRPQGVIEDLAAALGWPLGGGAGFDVNESEAQIHSLVGRAADQERLDAWQHELSRADRVVVEAICREALVEYGVTDFLPASRGERLVRVCQAHSRHLAVQVTYAGRRLRRIRSLGELNRKAAYRVRRALSRVERSGP